MDSSRSSMASISSLVLEIQTTATNSDDIDNDSNAKAKLLQLSLEMVQNLQQPNERIGSMAYAVESTLDNMQTSRETW